MNNPNTEVQKAPVAHQEAPPELIRVWPDWAQQAGLSRKAAYDSVRKMPLGVRVKLGRRVRINAKRLAEWLDKGGDLS